MGAILASKRDNDKVIVETLLEHRELAQLKGELDGIHMFSENASDTFTNITRRGKNEATTYFLVPRKLRRDISLNEPVLCQRIDTNEKAIFVYILQKDQFRGYQHVRKKAYLTE